MTDPAALLAGLDDEQRRAAETVEGPVGILAGAGTGKTRTITHRIAYGIAIGRYSAPRTMALTFTTRAAGELRSRLRALGAGEVAARTFHSAALAQLSHFWPRTIGGAPPRILDGKGPIVAEAARALGLPADQATLRDLAAEIEWRKVSDLGLDAYAATGRRVAGLEPEAVLRVLRGYEELKDDRRLMDFEDVLLATAGMLEAEPQVLRAVRDQYRTFVVDEYQDVSPIQYRLLRLWLGQRREICVVGDPNQTVYGFAGATPEHLLRFGSDFPGAEIVRLEVSHRSTQPILDAANRLIRGAPGALDLRGGQPGDPPDLRRFADERAEAAAVAEAIRADLAAGLRPQDVAVLVRLNGQTPQIEAALRDAGLSVSVRGDARFFEQPHVREAIVHLVAARRGVEPDAGISATVRGVLAGLGWYPEPRSEDLPAAQRERLAALDALHRLAEDADGGDYAAFVDDLLERQATRDDPGAGSVTVATIHAAKGLEWESVHVVGLSEGLLPIVHATQPAELDEERRLLYVAITRARSRLRLSGSGPRPPSRFVDVLALGVS